MPSSQNHLRPAPKVQLYFETAVYYPFLLGVAQAAFELGWDMSFASCLSTLRTSHPSDRNSNFDGIIIVGAQTENPSSQFNCPVVVALPGKTITDQTPAITWDWTAAGTLAAQYLLSLNYPRIVYWDLGTKSFDSLLLANSFLKTCAEHGKEVTIWNSEHLSERRIGNYEAFCDEQSLAHLAPCAIMTEDDRWASILISSLQKKNRRVPEEFAVMGVENNDLVQTLAPVKISTIDMDYKSIGYQAAYLLDDYIKSPNQPPKSRITQTGRLIERESTCMIFCKDPKIQEAFLFIRQNFRKPLTASAIARHCELSASSFSRKFYAEIGKSPSEELRDRRLECACSLLENTDLRLESIAVESGLGNMTNLWRLFKSKYGLTPGEWREVNRTAKH